MRVPVAVYCHQHLVLSLKKKKVFIDIYHIVGKLKISSVSMDNIKRVLTVNKSMRNLAPG